MSYQLSNNQIKPQKASDHEQEIDVNEQTIKMSKVRKRIDDLLEKKRLRELLDDTDDWEI